MRRSKKQIREFKVPYDLSNWLHGVSIESLQYDLDRLKELGATTVDIKLDSNWEDNFVKIEAFSRRLETDEEYKSRISEERMRRAKEKNCWRHK